MNKSFYERLFSGIILVIIALITIILGNDVLLVTVGIVSLIGLYEMNRVFGIEKYEEREKILRQFIDKSE